MRCPSKQHQSQKYSVRSHPRVCSRVRKASKPAALAAWSEKWAHAWLYSAWKEREREDEGGEGESRVTDYPPVLQCPFSLHAEGQWQRLRDLVEETLYS